MQCSMLTDLPYSLEVAIGKFHFQQTIRGDCGVIHDVLNTCACRGEEFWRRTRSEEGEYPQ
jgi:hypothetical protein